MSQNTPEEQIREFLARYIKGQCTEQEKALLEKWFGQLSAENKTVSLLNAAEEERLVMELWKAISAKEEDGHANNDEELINSSIRRRRMFRYAAIWAGAIVVAGASWMLWGRRWQRSSSQKEPVFIVVSTGYQQVRKVLLPDSSIVWLNSATHLYYHPDFAAHREIRLTGEAFFQVTPDAAHPFVVTADNASTRVIGTAFNVSAYPATGELRISLQSGKVRVDYDDKPGKTKTILTPGQLLIYNKETGDEQVMEQSPGEMDVWTSGKLLFYETPLKEALAQVEARYGVHIVYDHVLKNETITATFDNTALEKVLTQLSFGWDLQFDRRGDTLHVKYGKNGPKGRTLSK